MSHVPFRAGAAWFDQAWLAWRRRPLFFAAAALLLLSLRWSVDLLQADGASAAFIFFSYLTDALVFATVWMAISEDGGLAAGWKALYGRRAAVLKAGLWGLPSAAVGYLLLSLAPPLFQAVGILAGARAGSLLMLGWIFLVGWACCLLLFAAIFAAIEAARGETHLWTAGMKGLRAALLGWRPLLAVWTAFVVGATVFALLSAVVLGHVRLATLDGPERDLVAYWINWPALFLAVMALLALLVPAGTHLFAAAEEGEQAEGLTVAAFGEQAARRLAWALQALAAAVALAGLFVIDVDLSVTLSGALALFLTGRAVVGCAPAWADPAAGIWRRWRWLFLAGLPSLALWLMLFAGR
ncbi:MAG: hypothetical protein ACM31L_08955 [Actinomycetota bacterium]